jgi:hypothetical protein|nr:MAG TPA: hypothetical protein [Crassvirales sp.]DAU61410.1 MAG TPA: hypothetical protein [Crassvirales sp.]
MENNRLYDTLNRYFKRLSQVGYIPDNDTFSVLVLAYITELKEKTSLTSEQNFIIEKALSCLQGSCLIPYNSCKGTCLQ